MAHATEISFWTWRQEDKAAYNEFFADFTKENPDIHVKFESFPDEIYPTIVSTALAAGKATSSTPMPMAGIDSIINALFPSCFLRL